MTIGHGDVEDAENAYDGRRRVDRAHCVPALKTQWLP